MKYVKTFESINVNYPEEKYLKQLAKLATAVLKEDTDWKNIKNWEDIVSAFDIESEADNTFSSIFGEYTTRMLEIALRDYKKYLLGQLNEYSKETYKFINKAIDYICTVSFRFPLLRMNDEGRANFRNEITDFLKKKPNLVSNWNMISEISDIVSNFMLEGVEMNDITLDTFLEVYFKGVYGKIKKIIEENPTKMGELEDIECSVNIPEIIVKKLKNEKDWLSRSHEVGLHNLKNK